MLWFEYLIVVSIGHIESDAKVTWRCKFNVFLLVPSDFGAPLPSPPYNYVLDVKVHVEFYVISVTLLVV